MEYRKKIKDKLKENGKVSLAELKKLHNQHQPILYNIRRLLAENEIRPHIEVNPEIVKSVGITDSEIFFTLVNRYEYPQDVLKLINEMCGDDHSIAVQARSEFIRLCMEKGGEEEFKKIPQKRHDEIRENRGLQIPPVKPESFQKLALLLMSYPASGLKEKVAFVFTTGSIEDRVRFLNSFC